MRLFRTISFMAAVCAAVTLAPVAVFADSANHTYVLDSDGENVGVAPTGDQIHVSCEATEGVCGIFSVNPNSITASGEFEHFLPDGTLFASGTWTATQLISFHSYGCGVVFGDPIPPDLCGGAVKFAATFSTPIGDLPGVVTIFCVVGDKVPASIGGPFTEGVTVVVPGIINFNHPAGGGNIYVQLS